MTAAATALSSNQYGRIGIMVRTAREVFVYWEAATGRPLSMRVTDLSGRPPAELLDGRGRRDLPGPVMAGTYVANLLPGHLYAVELLDEDGLPVIGAGPVQTPWLPGASPSPFPAPYHRS